MGIGSKLSELMEVNGTNANELSKKIGVSPQTIYSIIKRDNKKIDIEVLIRISDAFGVDINYFRDSPQKPHTIAAHFDGDEYTEEQLDRIKAFAAFIKSENNK